MMGYTTEFKGELKFTAELKASQLAFLSKVLGEHVRDHPAWRTLPHARNLNYLDLKLTDDFSGIRWSGAEKSYYMVEQVNFIMSLMQSQWPDFGLSGQFKAQGEEFDDRWILTIVDGTAVKQEMLMAGKVITCPHCGEKFLLEAE